MELDIVETVTSSDNYRLLFYPTTNKFVVAAGSDLYIVSRFGAALALFEVMPLRTVREDHLGSSDEYAGRIVAVEEVDSVCCVTIENPDSSESRWMIEQSDTCASADWLHGLYNDGWLDVRASLRTFEASQVELDFYLPPIKGGSPKVCEIDQLGDHQKFTIIRDEITTVTYSDMDAGDILFSITTQEPEFTSGEDTRHLGVMLIAVRLDGLRVNPWAALTETY